MQAGNYGISGGVLTTAASGFWIYTTGANSSQTISSVISGTNISLNKAGAGSLTLSSASRVSPLFSGNTFTGQVAVNEGTLKLGLNNALGGALNALPSLMVNAGGVNGKGGMLDLNGNELLVGMISSQGAAPGAGVAGGVITSSSSSSTAILVTSSVTNGTFAGSIQGGV